VTLINCTLVGNYPAGATLWSYSSLLTTSSILWDNKPYQILYDPYEPHGAVATLEYCDVQGGWPGVGNIDSDPKFVSAGYWDQGAWIEGDYHIMWDSPCVDWCPSGPTDDMDGESRPADIPGVGYDDPPDARTYDIGADEYAPVDTDADGMPDWWELKYFGDLSQEADGDYDLDDLNNIGEYQHDLDPTNPNTDGDEAKDGTEIDYGSDPTVFTYFVDDASGDDLNDGLLPYNDSGHGPKKTIQAGIDVAASTEEVAVLGGDYSGPGNRDFDLGSKAIQIKGLGRAAHTIIDCQNTARGFYCNSIPDPGAVIDGFTIRNGNALPDGGAIYCEASVLTIENCIIENNSCTAFGGGICCKANSNAMITNCLVTGNSCLDKGGGVFCSASDITISNITVEGNSASNFGGGLMMSWGSNGTIANSILWGNTATQGAQIALKATAQPSTLSVSHCDVEGAESGAYVEALCTLDWGSGNIDSDPLFATGPLGDHYLSQLAAGQGADSPCVDAGSDTAAALGLDNLTTRTDGMPDLGIVDMGYHAPYALWIYSITRGSDDITIRWNALPGVSYTAQHSTNMADWTDVPVGETDTWTDVAVSEITKFYRVFEQ